MSQSTMTPTEAASTHEADIPPLGTKAKASLSQVEGPCHTSLSFAIPDSMAFFKRLTWEQTPWMLSQIPESDAWRLFWETRISPTTLENALPFGVCYPGVNNGDSKEYHPIVYVVFPFLVGRNVTRDPEFIEFWHNEVVKPNFDRAWENSGLVRIYGRPTDSQSRTGHWGQGTWTEYEARPASSFLNHLAKDLKNPVHTAWPHYELIPDGEEPWTNIREDQWPDRRAKVFAEAWSAIRSFVSHFAPELRDPHLLAVWKKKAHCNEAGLMVEGMGQLWDVYVDSRFIKKPNFVVHVEPGWVDVQNPEIVKVRERSRVNAAESSHRVPVPAITEN